MKYNIVLFCLTLASLFLNGFKATAQITPQFDGVVGAYQKTLVVNNFDDGTTALQALIDDVALQVAGGTIKLSGNVRLTKIYLKSNVHIDIAKGTVIKATPTISKPAVFLIGYNSNENIHNVKIFCSESDSTKPNDDISEKYVFDFSEFEMNGQVRAVFLSNATNFWISDAYIIDSLTQFSSITLNPYIIQTSSDNSVHQGLRDYNVIASPSKGDVRNIHGINQHGGYGVVQTQCARDVNFVKLSGIGGVTLRMESGAGIQFVGTDNEQELGVIKGIRASDLSLTNGFSCVTLSPHGRVNGDVYLENVKSVSSCFTVDLSTGFFDSELKDVDGNLVDPVKFKKGRFTGPIIIKKVHAVYGTDANGRKAEYDYIEKSIQTTYPWVSLPFSPETDKTREIPSAIAVSYSSIPFMGALPNSVEGEYSATIDGPITSSGFLSCITYHYQNILCENDRNAVDCNLFLPVEDPVKSDDTFKLYPNPSNSKVIIQHPLNSNVTVYDVLGRMVKSILTKNTETTPFDVTNFSVGVYIVQISSNKGITESKSLVVKNN